MKLLIQLLLLRQELYLILLGRLLELVLLVFKKLDLLIRFHLLARDSGERHLRVCQGLLELLDLAIQPVDLRRMI